MAPRRYPTGPARGTRRDPIVRDPWADDVVTRTGSMVHHAIAQVIGDPSAWRGDDVHERAWRLAAALVAPDPATRRDWRSKSLIAAGTVAYARHLLAPADWRSLGVELEVGDAGRVDIGWTTGSGQVVYDELKLATARGRSTSTRAWTRQAAMYAADGSERYGDRFAGVRLVLLGAARASRLVRPDGSWCPLPGTDLWFGVGRVAGADR